MSATFCSDTNTFYMVKVSVITPTIAGREQFLNRCIAQFNEQDYPNIEHIIIKGDGAIGAKLNYACAISTGDIILRMDDDDIYAPDWISKSVAVLQDTSLDCVGLSNAYFCDMPRHRILEYKQRPGAQLFLCGATLCFHKSVWERNKFREDIQKGEDAYFVAGCRAYPHDYKQGFLAVIHGNNTSSHQAIYCKEMSLSNETHKLVGRLDVGIVK